MVTVGVANIARRQYIINTSLPGLVGNMARHYTRVQQNTCTHSCNISPYCPLNQVIRYMYCLDGEKVVGCDGSSRCFFVKLASSGS